MPGSFRFLSRNLLYTPGAVLTASSFLPTLPTSFLLDQLKSKPWRSASGWTIVPDWNDKIDLIESDALVATLTPGTYATGALLAAEAQVALNAAGANTYSVTYDDSTHKFTITKVAGLDGFTLEWNTGANYWKSVGWDMGYDQAHNDTGGGPYVSDVIVYQSAHRLRVTLPSAHLARYSAIIGHNLRPLTATPAPTVLIEGSPAEDFEFPGYADALNTDAGDIRLSELADSDEGLGTNQYWRLTIADRQNPDGYVEIAGWIFGEPVATSLRPSVNYTKSREELSVIVQAIDGAHHGDVRPMRHVHGLEWLEIGDADLAILEGVQDENPPGRDFLMLFNSDDPEDVVYGCWAAGLEISMTAGVYWNVRGSFLEALG